ncbi:MAG: DUF58 domain-containing protein [Alphaproteobacteria bacterium]|nr:DUF58 domain-containing protein [Alphaproteobacteria bacterium]
MKMAPTPRAVALVAAAAPLALLIAVLWPKGWSLGLVWVIGVIFATLLDGWRGRATILEMHVSAPPMIGVGEAFCAHVELRFNEQARIHAARIALDVSAALDPGVPVSVPITLRDMAGEADIWLTPHRRGMGQISTLWLRWTGPLGLMVQQLIVALEQSIMITPDARLVLTQGARLFQRDALNGLMAQIERGEGAEFEALTEYHPGMDKRAIDWKASARHADLLAKEYRVERDNRIVLAIDCGRVMSEPLAGIARVDRAVTSVLLMGWVALKLQDRVSLYAFDSRPRVHTGILQSPSNFPHLQAAAAKIDYSTEETNFTLALSNLSQQLTRRSLIIIFTDFTDATGVDLMLRAVGLLLRRHAVLFVVMRDNDLIDIAQAAPEDIGTVARAVTAAALINEQRKIMLRLQRMGLDVIVADYQSLGLELVNTYLRLKEQGRL